MAFRVFGASAPIVLLLACALAATGCGGDRDGGSQAAAGDAIPESPEPIVVAATSPVAQWLVRRIGGDRVRLAEVFPENADHHELQPSAEQIVALGEAELIVLQGASYEGWRDAASLPESRVVDLSTGLSLIEVEGRTHSHGPEGEHSHTGVDPATWTDPSLVAAQSRTLLAALEQASPADAAGFLERAHALETELDRLAARIAELGDRIRAIRDVALAGEQGRYGYLARALGVEILPLEADPDDHDLSHLRHDAGARRLIVLWTGAPPEPLRSTLPDAAWVLLDPFGGTDGGAADYVARMDAGLGELERALAL